MGGMLRLRAVRTSVAASGLTLLWTGVGARRASATAALFLPLLAETLLEFLNLAVHELPDLDVLPEAGLVMAAVGATPPTLGIGLLAGGAQDAFRQRHRESRRIVHFGPWTTAARRCSH
jgi:hypothetical protein